MSHYKFKQKMHDYKLIARKCNNGCYCILVQLQCKEKVGQSVEKKLSITYSTVFSGLLIMIDDRARSTRSR